MPAHTIALSIAINAPPAIVFKRATTISEFAAHFSAIKTAEQLTSGDIGVGTRWRETRIMFGREATEELFFSTFTPPDKVVVSCDSHGAHYKTVFQFRPYLEGTRVDVAFSATALTMLAKIMSVLMGWMMTGAVRKMS